jgi:hypothetical protein
VTHVAPQCHNCFHFTVIFKFMAAKILYHCWKPMIIVWQWGPLIYCRFFNYGIIYNINLFSDRVSSYAT